MFLSRTESSWSADSQANSSLHFIVFLQTNAHFNKPVHELLNVVNYCLCWLRFCCFLASVEITLQTYLQIVIRWRLAWNLSGLKVSCHIVNKQRIRHGSPVWSYTLLKKTEIYFKIRISRIPSVSFSILYIIMSLRINCFKICQNVAERNLFYLKYCYSWTKHQLSFDLRIW